MATVIRGPLEFKAGHPVDKHFVNINTTTGSPRNLIGGGIVPIGENALAYPPQTKSIKNFVNANTSQSAFAAIRPAGSTTPPVKPNEFITIQWRRDNIPFDPINLLNTTFTDTIVAVSYPESFTIQRPNSRLDNTQYPNLLTSTLATSPKPFTNVFIGVPDLRKTLLNDAIAAYPVQRTLGTITGSTNYTNNNDTVSASGTTTIVGTSSTTNNNDTSSADGTITILGTSSTTNNNDTVSASGTIGSPVSGSANITEGADTSSASGTTTIVGSSTTTNNNDTSSAAGTSTIQGSLAQTNNNDNASAAGYVGNPPTVTTYLPLTGAGK